MIARLRQAAEALPCVHELFELQAQRAPARVALSFEGRELTYGELNRRANKVAKHLRSLGVGPETLVGVAVDRSIELVVAVLGILKAGGAYVPLDPDYPRERLAFMLDDARVPVLLVRGRQPPFGANDRKTVDLDAILGSPTAGDPGNTGSDVAAANLAYVIYTSGSTGKPKGVQIEHGSLSNFLLSMQSAPGITESDVLLAVTSVSFDIAGLELLLPLTVGARVVMTGAGVARDPDRLAAAIASSGATVMQATPTTWQMLVAGGWSGSAELRILCGGEPLSRKLATQLIERSKCLFNLYGPTETTIWSTLAEIKSLDEPITVGLPIAETEVYIVPEGAAAEALTLVPLGSIGELCIGGVGVARGYLHRPELTGEKFIVHPFGGSGGRLYRTGDLARQLPDGRIELFGRLDRQVKIRGARIELGEVEAAIAQHPSVKDCVVLGQTGPNGMARLVAYLVMATQPLPESATDATAKWRKVWSEVYREAAGGDGATFRTAGWNDSTTGLPMSQEEVGEWADRTAERILELRPARVLEVGCGNGMVLQRVARHCSAYIGLDITAEAVSHIRGELRTDPALSHVEVRQGSADEIESLQLGRLDGIVINSVMQYFPDVGYAVRVLEAALRKVEPGGFLFIGDVRSLPLLEAFHASVELSAAPDSLATHELHQRIRDGMHREKELVIDPRFFEAFAATNDEISAVEIRMKRGRHPNELTRFRYDVVLRRAPNGAGGALENGPTCEETDWSQASLSLETLPTWLGRQPADILTIARIPNGRVARELAALDLIVRSRPPETVGGLREAVRASGFEAVDPEELCAAADRLSFDVRLSWSRDPRFFDAKLTRRTAEGTERAVPTAPARTGERREERVWSTYANDPSVATSDRYVARTMRAFLRRQLPERMIPSQFVAIDALPRTLGGKLDAAALAALDVAPDRRDQAPIAPRDATERLLVEIWEEVLAVDGVGIGDDFCELGGDSLLAVEIMARLEKELRKNIPVASIFGTHRLTIAKQAAIIRKQIEGPLDVVSVIGLQPGGTRPPLFFAAAPMNLVRHLEADQPVYDLSIPAVHDRAYVPQVIDRTVLECVDAIRSVQPQGPYFLAGCCFGALLMLEVALRLQSIRHEVALLILIDPDPVDDVPIAARIVHHLRGLKKLSVKDTSSFFRQKTGTLLGTLRRMMAGPSKEAASYASLYSARWGKTHRTHPFRTALLLSRPKFERHQEDPMSAWQKRGLPELTLVDLQSDHYTVFTEPYVRVAAEKVTHCLKLAQDAVVAGGSGVPAGKTP